MYSERLYLPARNLKYLIGWKPSCHLEISSLILFYIVLPMIFMITSKLSYIILIMAKRTYIFGHLPGSISALRFWHSCIQYNRSPHNGFQWVSVKNHLIPQNHCRCKKRKLSFILRSKTWFSTMKNSNTAMLKKFVWPHMPTYLQQWKNHSHHLQIPIFGNDELVKSVLMKYSNPKKMNKLKHSILDWSNNLIMMNQIITFQIYWSTLSPSPNQL